MLFAVFSYGQSKMFVSTSSGNLYEVDAESCEYTLVKSGGVVYYDLAINPIDQKLYGVNNRFLYKIDKATGVSTVIASMGGNGLNALTFSSDGKMYGMSGAHSNLMEVDPRDGASIVVGAVGSYTSSGDLTFYKGQLYLTSRRGEIIQVDISNPQKSFSLGKFKSLSNVYGITASGCYPAIYAFSGNSIYKLDTSDLTVSSASCLGLVNGQIYGAASLGEGIPVKPFDLGEDIINCTDSVVELSVDFDDRVAYSWSTGATDTSILVSATGIYILNASTSSCEYSDTIGVYIGDESVFLFEDTALCNEEVLSFEFYSEINVLWNDGSTENKRTIDVEGEYWVDLSHKGCSWSDTFTLFKDQIEPFEIGADTTLCSNEKLTLYQPEFEAQYYWQDGTSDLSFEVESPGIYILKAQTAYCIYSDTIEVDYIETANASLGPDTTICEATSYLISPNFEFDNIKWSTGDSEPQLTVSTSGFYWAEGEKLGCLWSDTVEVNFLNNVNLWTNDTSM